MFPRRFVLFVWKLRLAGMNTLRKKKTVRIECVGAARAFRGFGLPSVLATTAARGFGTAFFAALAILVERLWPFARTCGRWCRYPNGSQLRRLGARKSCQRNDGKNQVASPVHVRSVTH
jgi:hypothetical protein